MAATFKPLTIRKLADKSEGERQVRYIARNVEVDDKGNALIDLNSVERILFNPATPDLAHEPWPLAGIKIEGNVPTRTRVSTSWVANARNEGWVTVTGEKMQHAPAGPPENEWSATHTFIELNTITIKTVDGNVKYTVTKQPGVYKDSNEPSGKRVDFFYECQLED